MNNHSHLVHKTLLWVGENCPHIRLWKNPTGHGYTIGSVDEMIKGIIDGRVTFKDAFKRLVRISFGIVGQADLSGIISPNGRRLEIEIKTGAGRQSQVQKNWQAMIEKNGGLYIVVRSIDDLMILKEVSP